MSGAAAGRGRGRGMIAGDEVNGSMMRCDGTGGAGTGRGPGGIEGRPAR